LATFPQSIRLQAVIPEDRKVEVSRVPERPEQVFPFSVHRNSRIFLPFCNKGFQFLNP
jgi:hypothetical protein